MWELIITTVLAVIGTPIVIHFYQKNHWLDDPKKNRHIKTTHNQAVPRGGGLIIYFSIIISSMLFLHFDKYLYAILGGATLLTLVGFLDDIYNLHPYIRMITGLTATLIVVGSGIGIAYISNPFGPGVIHLDQPQVHLELLGRIRSIWVLADLFAVIFILWNMNAVNWAKGVDGQLPGFVSVSLVFMALLANKFAGDPTQFNTSSLSLITAGAYLGFLYWNWYPQQILPGYGAGSLAGYFLSVLAILSGAKVATTLMVLSLPTADGIFTISRRLIAGKSPFWGDRGHLHHKLMDIFGWGRRRIALFYWLWSLSMGILSLYLSTFGKIVAIILSLVIVIIIQTSAKLKSYQLQGQTPS